MFPTAQEILNKAREVTAGAFERVSGGAFKKPTPTATTIPSSQDILNKVYGRTTPPAPGLVKTLAKAAPEAAAGAIKSLVAQDIQRRAAQTTGERAMTELVERPLKIMKAVGFDLPRLVLAGFSSVGKSLLESVYAPIFGKEQVRTALAGGEAQKTLERNVFAMETKTWQEVKDKIDAYTKTNQLATPWEKKNLGTVLAAGGFIADAYMGPLGGGKGKLAEAAIKELISITEEKAARAALVKYGIPEDIASEAATSVARARTDMEVKTAFRDASVRVLQRAEAEAAPRSSTELTKQLGIRVPEESAAAKRAKEIAEKTPGVRVATDIQGRAVSEQFIRKATTLETKSPSAKSHGFESIPEKEGYKTVFKPYGDEGAGYYYSKVIEDSIPSKNAPLAAEAQKYASADEFVKEFIRVTKKNTRHAFNSSAEPLNPQEEILRDSSLNYLQTPEVEILYQAGQRDPQILADFFKKVHAETALPKEGAPKLPELPEAKAEPEAKAGEVEPAPKAETERVNRKLEKMATESPTYDSFFERAGITQEALDKTAQTKGYPDAVVFYDKNKPHFTETDSYEVMAATAKESEYALKRSANEEETFLNDIRESFATLKGVEVKDLDFKFIEADLDAARHNYEITMDALADHPGRALMKYVSRTTGELPEFTSRATMQSLTGSGKRVATSEWAEHGDDIFQDLVGQELSKGGDVTKAQEFVDDYIKFQRQAKAVFQNFKNIRREIRLKKQIERFTEEARAVIARKVVRDTRALRTLVENIGKSAYVRGLKEGSAKYTTLVKSLASRRTQITAVKKRYNLTDAEMRKIRGNSDPRLMTEREFAGYLAELEDKARARLKWNEERILVDAIIQERDLKKTENLQRAMEFPPMKDMTLEQLTQFGDILAKTEAGDTFLGARMIQTAVNTDLGAIRTVGEGVRAIEKQTGMKAAQVEGRKTDKWLRDPTLVERDPLHKIFITEFVAREADMLTKEYQLARELDTLAKAARAARLAADARLRKAGVIKQTLRERIFARLVPQDKKVVQWLQPFETIYDDAGKKQVIRMQELRDLAEGGMTAEELKYAQFLEKFFSHYYRIAADEATARWTLLGVKHTNYREIYYLHMNRSFFERWRDDGAVKALKTIWDRDIAHAKVDFNAFGDRGEVLGYEKWLNRNMTRAGEGIDKETGKVFYTLNTAKAARAYFHAFERKLILDSMIPKIKLLEFLLGKKFQTPKSIANPEGTEKVHSLLRRHINEWINNKKGQRVEMVYEQGDRAESAVDGTRLLIAVQQLGINLIAQVIQVGGGEVMTFAGAGLKGWLKGHARALTKQGRAIGRTYSGIVGDTPWHELANASNDIGDTLRGGIFYLFGDLSFRARRQMLLGLMTEEEFAAGRLADKRVAEIKLQMGRWMQMPEFRSIAGSTSLVKAAGMYTEWATPIIQNTYFVLLPRLRTMARAAGPENWKEVASSKEFKELFRLVVGGAALGATAYLILNPDKDDRSTAGYIRRRAAQEISSTIQAITLWGVPTPFSIMNGYVDSLRTALGLLVTFERYETAGPGHAAGDLKAPTALFKAFVPRGIQQWIPEPETPIRTEADLKKEIQAKVKSGELAPAAAKTYAVKELVSIRKQLKTRRFEMDKAEYKADLKKRIQSGELSAVDARKEANEYIKQQKKEDPESFESDSDASFIDKVRAYAEALGTDPITAFEHIFTGQVIRRTDNGAIIVRRMSFEESEAIKEEWGAVKGLMLDHTLPLQLGGSNRKGNLKLVPKADWQRYTPVENYLGQLLRAKEIDEKKAKQLILDFKAGKIDEADVYAVGDTSSGSKTNYSSSDSFRAPTERDVDTSNFIGQKISKTRFSIKDRLLDIVEKLPFVETRAAKAIRDSALNLYAFTPEIKKMLTEQTFVADESTVTDDALQLSRERSSGDAPRHSPKGSIVIGEIPNKYGGESHPERMGDIIPLAYTFLPELGYKKTGGKNKIQIKDWEPHVIAHELAHAIVDKRGFNYPTKQFNADWEKAKKQDGGLLKYIDDSHIGGNPELYHGIDAFDLANERFAYLLEYQGELGNIPPILRRHYIGILESKNSSIDPEAKSTPK